MQGRQLLGRLTAVGLSWLLVFLQSVSTPLSVAAAPPPPPPPIPPAIAVAAVILDIAADVKKLFDTSNDDIINNQKEILKKLDQIQSKLNEMDQKLNTIIARFDELEFHIDRKFEEQRAIDVIATIRQIDQHYPAWLAKNYKPGKDPTVPDPGALLTRLRETSTALRLVPSFANFSTVALAMAYERLLLVQVFRAKPNNADMQRGFAQYMTFFEDAASAESHTTAISVGHRWSEGYSDWNTFMAQYQALPKPLRSDTGVRICCEQPSNWWYVGTLVNRYDGDPLQGFTAVAQDSNLLFGPGGTAKVLCYNSDHPAYPRRSGCPNNVGNVGTLNLDDLHNRGVAKKQVLDDLTAALDSLKGFHEQAALWAGIPKDQIAKTFPDPRKRPKLDVDVTALQKLLMDFPSLTPITLDDLLNEHPAVNPSDLPGMLKEMKPSPVSEPKAEAKPQ